MSTITRRLLVLAALALLPALEGPDARAQNEARAGEFYEDARKFYFSGESSSAIIQLKNALQADNQHVPSLALMGDVLLEIRDAAGARFMFEQALLLGGDSGNIVPKLAEAMLLQGDYAALVNQLSATEVRGAARAELLGRQALAHLALDNTDAAERAIADARAIAPSAWTASLAQMNLHLTAGDLDLALAGAQALTVTWPNRAAAWTKLGLVRQAMDEADSALTAYKTALDLSPDDADALLSRAVLLLDLGREDAALVDLDAYAEILPLDPRALYLRAQIKERAGDRESAIALFEKVVEVLGVLPVEILKANEQLMFIGGVANARVGNLESSRVLLADYHQRNPQELQSTRLLASILLQLGDARGAISLLRTSSEWLTDEPSLSALLASAYLQDGQFDRAITLFEGLDGSEEPGTDVHTQLARARLQAGQTRQGLDALLAAYARNPGQLDIGFAIATTYLEMGQPDNAIRIVGELLDRAPESPAFLNLLGEAELAMGQRTEAQRSFEEALSAQSDYAPATIGLAKVAVAAGDFEGGRRQLRRILAEDDENIPAMTALAQLELAAGDNRTATNLAEQAVRLDNTSLAARLTLINVHLETGQSGAAEAAARDALLTFADNLDVLAALARVHIAAGERDKALQTYRVMQRIVGFNPDQLHRIARLQMDLEAWSSARYTLYQSLTANPTHLPSSLSYTRVLLRSGQREEALENAQASLKLAPELAEAHGLQATALLALGRNDEADDAYRRALAMAHDGRWVLGRYRSLVARGLNEEAFAVLSTSVQSQPGDTMLRAALVNVLIQRERWAAARDELSVLLDQQPADAMQLNNMAYVLHELGESREALERARAARELAPENGLINDTLGWILVKNGSVSEGLVYLREAAARLGRHLEVGYHLAFALHELGRTGEARVELKRALEMAGPSGVRTAALALMEQIGDGD